ncbi:major sperm protein domain-containing protein, putative [Eimeria acervulina]|uniref:Major sperm protein domain-containing protein, putative n=1 Tax=Eimeria acervulina TaxID=5801 RepID=U6GCQ6_EIMAC|nr:major sperm protein domain-containing protein, putative [Eimeria acervulina]CDI77332.1 major sperm protein domain-containing protein, putative [Eimeria acervulina]
MPLLQIHPEKVLEVPFTLYSSSVVQLTLRNVSSHPFVAYKIKTTAPKNYLVRPSTGAVPQGESRSVQIVLQAMTEEPPKTATDRFLVQATPVESTAPLPRSYWLELSRSEIEETRLSVSFKRTGSSEAAAAAAAAAAAGAGGGAAADRPGPGSGEDKGDADGAPAPAAAAPGSSSSGSSSSSSSSSSSGAAGDLRQQYDQLVEYTLAMERHKEELVHRAFRGSAAAA